MYADLWLGFTELEMERYLKGAGFRERGNRRGLPRAGSAVLRDAAGDGREVGGRGVDRAWEHFARGGSTAGTPAAWRGRPRVCSRCPGRRHRGSRPAPNWHAFEEQVRGHYRGRFPLGALVSVVYMVRPDRFELPTFWFVGSLGCVQWCQSCRTVLLFSNTYTSGPSSAVSSVLGWGAATGAATPPDDGGGPARVSWRLWPRQEPAATVGRRTRQRGPTLRRRQPGGPATPPCPSARAVPRRPASSPPPRWCGQRAGQPPPDALASDLSCLKGGGYIDGLASHELARKSGLRRQPVTVSTLNDRLLKWARNLPPRRQLDP